MLARRTARRPVAANGVSSSAVPRNSSKPSVIACTRSWPASRISPSRAPEIHPGRKEDADLDVGDQMSANAVERCSPHPCRSALPAAPVRPRRVPVPRQCWRRRGVRAARRDRSTGCARPAARGCRDRGVKGSGTLPNRWKPTIPAGSGSRETLPPASSALTWLAKRKVQPSLAV